MAGGEFVVDDDASVRPLIPLSIERLRAQSGGV